MTQPQHAGSVPDHAEHDTFCPRSRRVWVLLTAIVASSMGLIDSFVVSLAMPAIRSDLDASLSDGQWISNSYVLFLSALMLVGGAAGDRFGLRVVFGIGISAFTLASAGCALAPDSAWLIVARSTQGIGAALMIPVSLAIIAKAYPRAERGRAIGIWAAAGSLTMVLGPIISGAVISNFGAASWRWLFGINLPLGALAMVLLMARVPGDAAGEYRRLDWWGALLATAGLALVALGLTGAGEARPPFAISPWMAVVAGLALLAGFVVRETLFDEPMVPLGLFRSAPFSGANALTFALYFALSANLFFLPMTVISAWGYSVAETASVFVPIAVLLTVMSGPSGALADRLGPAPLIALGSALAAAAFAGLALTAERQNLWFEALPLMTVVGVGMGLVVSPLSAAVMTAVEDEQTAVASGINTAVSRVAALVAVAAMGAVAARVFAGAVDGTPAAGLGVSFGVLPKVALPEAAEAARVAASNAAFSAVAWGTAALAGIAAAIAWLTLEWKGNARRRRG